jgi:AbrB family looped-hinge helix DNA binding protein
MGGDGSITSECGITQGDIIMEGQTTTVTSKGQVTIPVELRRALNIKPKDRVAFELVDGEVRLRRVQSRLLAGYGAVTPHSRPLDFRKLRQETEKEIAEEVIKEG